jgi:hypothetical protein
MQTQTDLTYYLSGNEYSPQYVRLDTRWNTIYTIYAPDSSILEYLNGNGFPVVYADTNGLIIVKF